MFVDCSGRGIESLEEVVAVAKLRRHGVSALKTLNIAKNKLKDFLLTEEDDEQALALYQAQDIIASYNLLSSSLSGVGRFEKATSLDLSYNALGVFRVAGATDVASGVAGLGLLPHLAKLDVSSCKLSAVDFGIAHRSRSAGGVGSQLAPPLFQALEVLCLARNALEELPTLLQCTQLTHLDVSWNRIESLDDIDAKLPSGIRELNVEHNDLAGGLTALTPLGYLARTLERVAVGSGNTRCVSPRLVGWRPFLCFLLPSLTHVDNQSVHGTSDCDLGRHVLFRSQQVKHKHGHMALDEGLLRLLDEGRDGQLLGYLRQVQNGGASIQEDDSYHHQPMLDSHAAATRPPATRSTSIPVPVHSTAPKPASRSPPSSHASQLDAVDVCVVVEALQQKVARLDKCLQQLWMSDVARRKFAAVIIQAYFRGYLVRRKWSLRRRRLQKRSGTQHTSSQSKEQSRAETNGRDASAQHRAALPATSSELHTRVAAMDKLLRQVWADSNVVKTFFMRQYHRAARTIQTHYRAHRARKVYREMRRDYEHFQRSFLPYVLRLQETGRRFMRRRRLVADLEKEYHTRTLRADVATLKETVRGLQATVQLLLRERRTQSLRQAQENE